MCSGSVEALVQRRDTTGDQLDLGALVQELGQLAGGFDGLTEGRAVLADVLYQPEGPAQEPLAGVEPDVWVVGLVGQRVPEPVAIADYDVDLIDWSGFQRVFEPAAP